MEDTRIRAFGFGFIALLVTAILLWATHYIQEHTHHDVRVHQGAED